MSRNPGKGSCTVAWLLLRGAAKAEPFLRKLAEVELEEEMNVAIRGANFQFENKCAKVDES